MRGGSPPFPFSQRACCEPVRDEVSNRVAATQEQTDPTKLVALNFQVVRLHIGFDQASSLLGVSGYPDQSALIRSEIFIAWISIILKNNIKDVRR